MATKKNVGTPADYDRWNTPPVSGIKVTKTPPGAKKVLAELNAQKAKQGGKGKK